MRRYSEAFLIVALFCFLFPFSAISPATDAGVLPMTGWDMLSSQNITVSKQPPIILNIPLRIPMVLALIAGGGALLLRLARRTDVAWVATATSVVAAISLLTMVASSPLVQLTDGQTVLHRFPDPAVRFLPAFYISLGCMAAAAISLMLTLRQQSIPQAAMAFRSQSAVPVLSPGATPTNTFCSKCGSGLAPAARFCNRCGLTVPATRPIAKQSAAQQAPTAVMATLPVSPAVPNIPLQAPVTVPTKELDRVAPPPPVQVTQPSAVFVPASVIVPPIQRSRFSTGARLGFAVAVLVVAVAAWFVFNPSIDNSASVAAPTAVSVSPSTVRVIPGGTVQLQAVVTGGRNREVQWTIQEGSSGGSVESAGAMVRNGAILLLANYKAPVLPGVYHVIAASTANQDRQAAAQVIVEYSWSRRF